MVDFTKPLQTRGGRGPIRLLCVDGGNSEYPVVALVPDINGVLWPESFTAGGHQHLDGRERPLDLTNVPEERVSFYNFHEFAEAPIGVHHQTEALARATRRLIDGRDGPVLKVTRIEGQDPRFEVV